MGLLCVLNDIGSGAGVLFNNLNKTYPLKGLGCDPGKDIKGNGSWRSAYKPVLIRYNTAITTAKVL